MSRLGRLPPAGKNWLDTTTAVDYVHDLRCPVIDRFHGQVPSRRPRQRRWHSSDAFERVAIEGLLTQGGAVSASHAPNARRIASHLAWNRPAHQRAWCLLCSDSCNTSKLVGRREKVTNPHRRRLQGRPQPLKTACSRSKLWSALNPHLWPIPLCPFSPSSPSTLDLAYNITIASCRQHRNDIIWDYFEGRAGTLGRLSACSPLPARKNTVSRIVDGSSTRIPIANRTSFGFLLHLHPPSPSSIACCYRAALHARRSLSHHLTFTTAS